MGQTVTLNLLTLNEVINIKLFVSSFKFGLGIMWTDLDSDTHYEFFKMASFSSVMSLFFYLSENQANREIEIFHPYTSHGWVRLKARRQNFVWVSNMDIRNPVPQVITPCLLHCTLAES